MVAGHYGYQTDLTSLRKKHSISSHGTTLKELINIASQLNLTSRALSLDMQHLNDLQLPCILHWELNHFVVLKRIGKKNLHIVDPAVGERSISIQKASKSFTGVALELSPSGDFKPANKQSTLKLRDFFGRLNDLKRNLAYIFILSLLLQLFVLLAPFYMQTVIDDGILRSDSELIMTLAIGFGLLLVIEVGTYLLRQIVILNFSSRMNIQMSSNVFQHLTRLPMDYFVKRHMGDIISRFGSLEKVRELFTTTLVAAAIDGLLAIFTLIVMFFYSPTLTLVVLVVAAVYLFLRLIFYRPIRTLTEEGILIVAKENTHFMETIRAIQTIKLFQKENDRHSQWKNKLVESMNKNIQLARWHISFNTSNKLLFGAENILVIYLAATSIMNDLMSVGMLYAFISYKNRFIESVNQLIDTWIEFKMLDVHLNRLSDIVSVEPERIEHLSSDSVPHLRKSNQGKIIINNLSYAYSLNEPSVLKGLSFEIEDGETIAIVGPSGCGKTTLLKCMMGLFQPSSGSIELDGVHISSIADYRKMVASVMQDDQLLSGSVADNIACFEEYAEITKIKHYASIACIDEEIMAMPMQYNTLIGDMGSTLSNGQKQRIILARALYRQPKILFMDEATSHLDVANEMAINEQIRKLSITSVIVAHRPETIRSADRIIDLTEINSLSE
ncbi:MAG: ATP-binding cassette subfamily B protein RaxB [Arenicella sp.]|jgi:ATP-binding cassette subfamily B protein RaxB